MADLIGAVRLPEGSMRATAGTDVVIDVLVFQRRAEGQEAGGAAWRDLVEVAVESSAPVEDDETVEGVASAAEEGPSANAGADAPRQPRRGVVQINAYFAAHPEMVLGTLAQKRGIYGPGLSTTVPPRPGEETLEAQLDAALSRLPARIFQASAESTSDEPEDELAVRPGTAADGATIKEGSFFLGKAGVLMQIVEGRPVPVAIRDGKGGEGHHAEGGKDHPRPAADPRRSARGAARPGRRPPWRGTRSGCASPTRPSSATSGRSTTPSLPRRRTPETGEERETHRRPNLAPFADDPDCWLVASIEDYDLESGLARMGPVSANASSPRRRPR